MPVRSTASLSLCRRHQTSNPQKANAPEREAVPKRNDTKVDSSQPDLSASSSQNKSDKSAGKSIAQQDQELQEKLSAITGDGGSAGIEYEDGKPADMKRSVKNNMFRYI
ncbi:hypothetical protein LIA77_07983 [Sarocladium implicatum]|nr:hypothetical protein LIA77_07983 [Sarocladium implicatum]